MNSRNERKNRLLNQNLRVICLSFCHTEAHEKGRAYIVAEAQKIIPFFDTDMSFPYQICGYF